MSTTNAIAGEFEKLIQLQKEKNTASSKKRALLIGINYFGTESKLSGCVNDVNNMKEYLTDIGFTDIVILKDSPSDCVEHKKPDAPTRNNILNAMKQIVSECNAGDTLYVHYSGHGSHINDRNSDEHDGQDECICPVDFDFSKINNGFIVDDELNDLLVKALPKGVKLRVCFDSCHSGSALDLPKQWISSQELATENDDLSNEGKDVIFISGCEDVQTSADSRFDGKASGAMTWALLNGLNAIKGSGKFSKLWTWQELIQMMRCNLKKERYDQIPQLSMENANQLKKYVDLI